MKTAMVIRGKSFRLCSYLAALNERKEDNQPTTQTEGLAYHTLGECVIAKAVPCTRPSSSSRKRQSLSSPHRSRHDQSQTRA